MNSFVNLLSWESVTIFVGGLATLAIYSFLIKENSFYRFFEHLFIGISAGLLPIFSIRDFIWPNILAPLLGYDLVKFPDGTYLEPYDSRVLLYLFPAAFGLLYYTIYSRRLSWMIKIVIGFSLGASAGLYFKGFFAEVIPQIIASFRPLYVPGVDLKSTVLASANNIFFILTLLLVFNYFLFTFKFQSRSHALAIRSGRWLMMICFGSFFGSTVMARLALLVERLQFLIIDWFGLLQRFFK